MKKLATFWNVLIKSLFSPLYYAEIIKEKLSFSFKFYFNFFFFYAVIFTLLLTFTAYWPLQGFLNILPDELKEIYPEELVIDIENGEASVNVNEPYFIPMDKIESIMEEFDRRVLGANTGEIINLMVIDTEASIEDIHDYQTAILLTRTHLAYLESDKIEAFSLKRIDNITIDQAKVNTFVNKAAPVIGYALPFLIIATFVLIAVAWPLFNMIYLAFFALIILLLSKIISSPLNYKRSYQMGLHLIAMPTGLFFIVNHILGVPIFFAFSFTIVMAVWAFFVLSKIKNKTFSRLDH